MTTRRQFLRQSGKATLASLLMPAQPVSLFTQPKAAKWPIGLQLYTLNGLMHEEPKATLEKIAAIGYKEIESAGLYGYTPKEFSRQLTELGLHWRSMHVVGAPLKLASLYGMAKPKTAQDSVQLAGFYRELMKDQAKYDLTTDLPRVIDQAAEGGVSYLVCAGIPVGSLDQIKTAVDVFNKVGERAKKAGIQFAYHNHATEFDMVEGVRPFDYIMAHTDKSLVKMELDLAWATSAGQDVEQLFKQYPGRYPLWHVKDIKADKKSITEVGNGIVDFKHIFQLAKLAGLKYFFVEQDMASDPLKSIATSYANLQNTLG